MFFQKVLKGICGIDDDKADAILLRDGIKCRWWENVHHISPAQIAEKLNQRNLHWHLNRYSDADPMHGGDLFYNHTPFISTTAGSVERDARNSLNVLHSPFLTALHFATRAFTETGYIFYGYVYTLGKKAIELMPFAEEVRELNVYTDYLPFHTEGEIAAKIIIPAVNLEKYEKFEINDLRRQRRAGKRVLPLTKHNISYARPEDFANIREALL